MELKFFLIVVGVVVVIWLLASITIVPAQQVGVRVLGGRVGKTARSGPRIALWPTKVNMVENRDFEVNPPHTDAIDADSGTWYVDVGGTFRIADDPRHYMFGVEDPKGQLSRQMWDPIAIVIRSYRTQELLKQSVWTEIRATLEREIAALAESLGVDLVRLAITKVHPTGATKTALAQIFQALKRQEKLLIDARAEAEVTAIEMGAQGDLWAFKTHQDTLVEIGRNGNLIIIDSSGSGDPHQTRTDPLTRGLLGQQWREQKRLLPPSNPSERGVFE